MFVSAGAVALLWRSRTSLTSAVPAALVLGRPAAGGAFMEFALRRFNMGIDLTRYAGIRLQTPFALRVANAIFLPINYGWNSDSFSPFGGVRLRRLHAWHDRGQRNELAAWTLVAASFLIGTFLRSSTLSSNDLGWRCFLPAQLILLLWGATMVHDWWFRGDAPPAAPHPWAPLRARNPFDSRHTRTGYQVFMLRMFPVLVDRQDNHGDFEDRAGGSEPAIRQAGLCPAFGVRALDAQLPSSAVLQSNPVTKDLVLHMLYSGRDAAASDGRCGIDFGGDAEVCASRVRKLTALFRFPDGSNLDAVCREYGIDAVVVEDADQVWREPSSWGLESEPSSRQRFCQGIRCGARRIAFNAERKPDC